MARSKSKQKRSQHARRVRYKHRQERIKERIEAIKASKLGAS